MGENSYGISGGKLANGTTAERITADITAPATEDAKQWDGWGSALKPANEPIVLARKPLEKGLSIAENVLKNSTGGLNIDGCRVGNEELSYTSTFKRMIDKNIESGYRPETMKGSGGEIERNVTGRFPANLILTHHPECECIGTKKVKAISGGVGENSMGGMGKNGIYGEYALNKLGANAGGLGDENGQETIENWNCHPDCPVKLLDEQSGEVGGDTRISKSTYDKGIWGNANPIESVSLYNDTGGASRFFMNFDSGGNDSFFYYIYEEINTKIFGNILENQKVVGMLNGVMLEAEKYIQSVEQFMFGNKSMENYQMDAKYTISTLTKQMIELKTCNALQGLNIDFYTEELLKTINSLTILSIEDVNFANCINRFKNLLLELVEHIKGIVNHVKSPYYKNGEKTIEKNTTHTRETIGKDQKHRFFYTAKASTEDRNEGLKGFEEKHGSNNHNSSGRDIGGKLFCEICKKRQGACACEEPKFSKQNPNTRQNIHPTVKPTELMRYLCRLITPPNGVVLDPFMGSGSTGKAAILEGFKFIGMELEEEYYKIAEARIAKAERDYLDSIAQLKLF